MDLTVKSKSWAGNIYHQFESICQDVDDFMSKDTVKFVENQVQSVGKSVKRFYSHVVQDKLPPCEDLIVKPESQSMDGEQVDKRDSINSLTNIEANHIGVKERQLSENQVSNDIIRNSDASLPIGVQENITSVDYQSYGKRDFDRKKENKGFSEDTEFLSNISSSDLLFKSEWPVVEDPNLDENRISSDPRVALAHIVNEGNSVMLDSPDPSCDALEKDGTLCDRISSNDETYSPECILADFSCDEEDEERGKRSSNCSASPKFSSILDSSSGNGNTHEFGDLSMETVDLSPDVKHDEPNVVLNVDFVHAASHRRRNFRYYKKLIHDALTSRKRLSKEYEHLAILYADIDLESNEHVEPSSVPSSQNTSVHALRTQSFQDMSETDWELV